MFDPYTVQQLAATRRQDLAEEYRRAQTWRWTRVRAGYRRLAARAVATGQARLAGSAGRPHPNAAALAPAAAAVRDERDAARRLNTIAAA